MVVAGAGLMAATLPFETRLPDLDIDGSSADQVVSLRCQTPLLSILRDRPAEGDGGWFAYAPGTEVSAGSSGACVRRGQNRAALGAGALVLGFASAFVLSRRSAEEAASSSQ